MSVYHQNEDLINVGAYVKNSNPKSIEPLKSLNQLKLFLKQDMTL